MISLIAAVAKNGIIGSKHGLPWDIPQDLRYFKHTTIDKPIVMGRKTYEFVGVLSGRTNIVVTRKQHFQATGVQIAHSLDDAFSMASIYGDETMVIGGAEIYSQSLNKASRLYITEIHAVYFGNKVFPTWDKTQWAETSRQDYTEYSFVIYEKRTNGCL